MNQIPSSSNAGDVPSNPGSEDALQRSEERYRALMRAIGQVVWTCAPDGTPSDSQEAKRWWCDLTGQTVEDQEVEGAWMKVIHPVDQTSVAEAWQASLLTGLGYDVRYRVRGKRGDWRHISARAQPSRSSDGAIFEWIGTLEDVTAQLEGEAERRRLEEVFQYAPSFIAVFQGPAHIFERVNDRYLELIGARDVVGLPVREALPEIEGQKYFELLDQVYQTGKAYSEGNAQVMLHTSAGHHERIVEFVYQPVFDAAGTVSGVIAQGIDLTERKQAEVGLTLLTAEKERHRRMYETALSNTADFVYLFDLNGRFTFVNKALLDLWGKELSQAVGKNFHELEYPLDLAERLQLQIQTVIDTGEPLRDETPYTSDEGTESYEYIFVPVFGSNGKVEAVAGSTRQITDRKHTEMVLRQKEERYRALVNATSDVIYRMSADWTEMRPLDGRDLVASSALPSKNWMEQNLPTFEHERVKTAIDLAISKKDVFQLTHQVIRADGTLGWTFSRAIPVLNLQGEIVEWFGAASDVTRRMSAEEALHDITSRMEAALAAGAIGTWS